MFIDADEVAGGVMEVILNCVDGEEYVYWVALENKPEDEDEYDWSISQARSFHVKQALPECPEDNEDESFSEALEPFSRDESEFSWVR